MEDSLENRTLGFFGRHKLKIINTVLVAASLLTLGLYAKGIYTRGPIESEKRRNADYQAIVDSLVTEFDKEGNGLQLSELPDLLEKLGRSRKWTVEELKEIGATPNSVVSLKAADNYEEQTVYFDKELVVTVNPFEIDEALGN